MKLPVTILLVFFTMVYPVSAAVTYKDVPTNHWGYNAIYKLSQTDIIKGYPDSTFKPDSKITREHIAIIFSKYFGLKLDDAAKLFIPADNRIELNSMFHPNLNITREEAVKAIVLASKLDNKAQKPDEYHLASTFKDWESVSPELKEYVAIASYYGILNGDSNGNFLAKAVLSRAELCVMFNNLDEIKPRQYPITYSDGSTSTINVFIPACYVKGQPQKWIIICHSGGGSGAIVEDYIGKVGISDTGIPDTVLIGINGANIYGGNFTADWVDLPEFNRSNKHFEEGIAYIKKELGLTHYLPAIIGFSMGGYRVLNEMYYRPEQYSCFVCSAPVTSFIDWQNAGSVQDWRVVFGGELPPNGDPVSENAWTRHSMRQLFTNSLPDLKGRKLWIANSDNDGTLPTAQMFTPFMEIFPSQNVYKKRVINNGGHIDFVAGGMGGSYDTVDGQSPPFYNEVNDFINAELREHPDGKAFN